MKTKRFRFLPLECLENTLNKNPMALMKIASQLSHPNIGINPTKATINPTIPKIVDNIFIMC